MFWHFLFAVLQQSYLRLSLVSQQSKWQLPASVFPGAKWLNTLLHFPVRSYCPKTASFLGGPYWFDRLPVPTDSFLFAGFPEPNIMMNRFLCWLKKVYFSTESSPSRILRSLCQKMPPKYLNIMFLLLLILETVGSFSLSSAPSQKSPRGRKVSPQIV